MNYSLVQTDLFGDVVRYPSPSQGLKFCLKMDYSEKSGLQYGLRLEVPQVNGKSTDTALAKSFALKNGPSMNPHHKPIAVMVDDHKVNAFRREGTILRGVGMGAVLHFDEGFFTIPGCNSSKEVHEAFQKGLEQGKLKLIFTGYKMKGEFHFYRKTVGRYSQWVIQKANDSYATGENMLLNNKSILTGHSLQHYLDIYYKQKQIMYKLSQADLALLHRKNDDASFQYKRKELVHE